VYDTLPWYWRTVGTDYEPALMLTRMTHEIVAEASKAGLMPYDFEAMAGDLVKQLGSVAAEHGKVFGPGSGESPGLRALLRLKASAEEMGKEASAARRRAGRVAAGSADPAAVAALNAALIGIDRAWLDEAGLPERAWFRNTYASPDENSGYAPWTLPLLRRALARKDEAEFQAAAARYERVVEDVRKRLREVGVGMTARDDP
jgi:hypothetical protein